MRYTLVCLCVSALLAPFAAAQTVVDPALTVEVVVTDIPNVATGMVFLGPDDILIGEKQTGRVRRVIAGVLQPDSVLDLFVNNSSERGLLGMTLDPRFPLNRHVYLYVTEADGIDNGAPLGNRVYRYTWDGTLLVDPLLVLDLPATPGPNHDGGIIEFGPDDRLYAIIGDLNRNGQLENFPNGAAPDDTAVITRTDGLGNPLADNPFFDKLDPENPLGRYFAYGVRNSFGFGFDPLSGDLWDTENGPFEYDEINRHEPGANSGWETLMGPDARDPQSATDLWYAPGAFYVDPQFSWLSTTAPTAVAFAESPVLGCGNLHRMFVGDNNCGQLYRFELTGDRKDLVLDGVLSDRVADNSVNRCTTEQSDVLFGSGFGVVTDIENGPDGAFYVVSGFAGTIYRIVPDEARIADADLDRVDDACDCAPDDAGAFAPPTEVPRLRVSRPASTWLGWDSQSATAGAETTYTVATGTLSALRVDAGFADACALRSGFGLPQLVDFRMPPPPDEGYWYLVRASNACYVGTYGDAGIPGDMPGAVDPRDALDAALLPPCALEPGGRRVDPG